MISIESVIIAGLRQCLRRYRAKTVATATPADRRDSQPTSVDRKEADKWDCS